MLPCFYCSVDGRELKMIFIVLIGSLVLGSACFLAWTMLSGIYKKSNKIKFDVFEAEKRS